MDIHRFASFLLPAAFAIGMLPGLPCRSQAQQPRSVRRLPDRPRSGDSPAFDAAQSAGLFVGVRRFTHDQDFAEVRYAVDDAIDLAFLVALDLNVRLVQPGRVILALSGEPQKPESQQRLDALLAAGAQRRPAGQADVLMLLESQARAVGKGGILILAFATHGFTKQGNQYLATATSILEHWDNTTIAANQVFDIAARSAASRRLIFLDACRERLTANARQIEPDPRSAASRALIDAIAQARGEVIFFAAAAGDYAYDDDVRKNGVFTAAVLDGLRCGADADDRGFVTVETLRAYVNDRVTAWRRKRGDATAADGISSNLGGTAAKMALASCSRPRPQGGQPAVVRSFERTFNVFDLSGIRLWGGEVAGRIVHAEVADLYGDGRNEVVVGVGAGGEDTGKILAYSSTGERLWSADTTTRFNYQGGQSGKMAVDTFATGDLFRQGTRQIVALAIDAQAWYPSRLCIFDGNGTLLSSYWHPGHLHQLTIGSPTPLVAPRIIVGGVNNDLRSFFKTEGLVGIVFMLDPKNVHGEAPPFRGNSQPGSELWYGVLLPENQYVERLEIVDRYQDGANQISVWTSTHHVFYLDFAGQVTAEARPDGAQGSSRFILLGKRE